MNVVGTTVDVLDVHAEVLGDVASNLTDPFCDFVGEEVCAVLRNGHEVILERVDRVRPGFEVVLHLAVLISIHPILIKVCCHGVFGLQPMVVRVGVVGFTPALKIGILALIKDSTTHRDGRRVKLIKTTAVIHTESFAVWDVHCCVKRGHDTKAGTRSSPGTRTTWRRGRRQWILRLAH